jgi:hypothetical protein
MEKTMELLRIEKLLDTQHLQKQEVCVNLDKISSVFQQTPDSFWIVVETEKYLISESEIKMNKFIKKWKGE